MLDDGDLWQAFSEAVQIRGADSIAISWTKGHASWQHIIAMKTNALAVANGQADMAADQATEACDKGVQQMALSFHAQNQKHYEKTVARLQVFAAKLLVQDKKLRQEAGFQAQGKKAQPVTIEVPPCESRMCFTEGEVLNLLPLPPSIAATKALLHIF